MAVLERLLAVVVVLLLVGCSSVPVGAASSCTGCADEIHRLVLDRGVLVQGTDGQPYAVLTNATHPDTWYSKGWVKHNDTVTTNRYYLDPTGFVQVYITPPASSVAESASEACMWPWPTEPRSGVPAIGAMVVVGYTAVTGTEIVVLSTGALMVGEVTYDIKTNLPWYAEFSRQLADSTTALTSSTRIPPALHDACRHLDRFPARVQQDLQNENDYNNAIYAGRPTNNYNPKLYKKDDPNSGDTIVDRHQSAPSDYKPYSCIVIYSGGFYDPDLIRYYDRNGKFDCEKSYIDFGVGLDS